MSQALLRDAQPCMRQGQPCLGQEIGLGGVSEIPSNQKWFMIISLKVPLIRTQVYCQGQLDTTDTREATCHLK